MPSSARRGAGAVALLALLAGCGDERAAPDEPAAAAETAPVSSEPPPPRAEPAIDFLERIDSLEDWRRLAAPSDEHAIARTETVKVTLDHRTGAIYFMQSGRWPIHYDFAVRLLTSDERSFGDRAAFNRRNYMRPDRELQLASLVRYRDGDRYALELGPADTLEGEQLVAFLERLRPRVFFAESLRYRPRSELHRRLIRGLGDRLHVLEVNELWAAVRYQPITLGAAVGRLRVIAGQLDPASVLPDEILVLRTVPDDLPVCAGVITAELQAPLAHIAVLSQSRGTPNMALRGALEDPRVRALDQRIVRLDVARDDFTLSPSSPEALAASVRARRPAPVRAPPLALDRLELADLSEVRLRDVGWAGAKAAQLGELSTLEGVETAGGLVVPAGRYVRHLSANRIDARSATLRATRGFDGDGRLRDRRLGELRAAIEAAPIDPALLAELHGRMRLQRGRWILRSSTNAEDLPGFSGAGLYDSVVTGPDPDAEAIARALREVWASVYERRAWDEREWYGVDHDAVAMAVLVQPFLADVTAMGVAITENPFSSRRSGILVDLAPSGGSVTGAEGEELPEQILLYRNSRPEVISRSTQNAGRPLLAERAMRPLQALLDRIHAHLLPHWDGADAADIELALLRDGRTIILQARPYRMRRAP